MNFMRINGTPVRRVEGHFLDCPGKGRMLVVTTILQYGIHLDIQ